MSEEWDDISNNPEDNEEEDSPFAGIAGGTIDSNNIWARGATTTGASYNTYVDSSMALDNNEIIRVSSENDFECSRHGRVQSFRLFANGYGGDRPPREVNTCLHCFMDLLSRQCNAIDSDHDRREVEHRDMMARMTAIQSTQEEMNTDMQEVLSGLELEGEE